MSQTVTFDPVRQRMLVFGGHGSGSGSAYLNDTWAFALTNSPGFALVANAPIARRDHSAIHDPVRDRLIFFGGVDDAGRHNDVVSLSLSGAPTWALIYATGTAPNPIAGHSAVYDPIRDRMIVIDGGTFGSSFMVWTLSLAGTPRWSALSPTGPTPSRRNSQSAIYDPVRDRVIVFGGYNASGVPLNDVWALSLSGTPSWVQLLPTGAVPAARFMHSAVYDAVRDRMVVFGGYYYLNDVWALPLAGTPAWTQLSPSGTGPGGRHAQSAIYDPMHDRMVVFGGNDLTLGYASDVWALTWNTAAAVNPPPSSTVAGFLGMPAPNPVERATTIRYAVAQACRVRLGIFDVSGRLVRRLMDADCDAGNSSVNWDGTDDSGGRALPGLYFIRLDAPRIHAMQRVVLLAP